MGDYNKIIRNNSAMRKNRTSMYQNKASYRFNFGKKSTRVPVELTDKKKREIATWSNRYNTLRALRLTFLLGIPLIITGALIFYILF